MKLRDSLIAWNPKSNQVKVGPLKTNQTWSRGYSMTAGGCWANVKKMSQLQAKAYCFIEAMHLIIRDRVDPDAVHQEFCKIAEYNAGLANDVPGSLKKPEGPWG